MSVYSFIWILIKRTWKIRNDIKEDRKLSIRKRKVFLEKSWFFKFKYKAIFYFPDSKFIVSQSWIVLSVVLHMKPLYCMAPIILPYTVSCANVCLIDLLHTHTITQHIQIHTQHIQIHTNTIHTYTHKHMQYYQVELLSIRLH